MTAIVELKKCNQSREQWDERRKVILDDVSLEIESMILSMILGGQWSWKINPLIPLLGRFR